MLTQAPADFVREVTRLGSARLVPNLKIHIADELTPLWEKTELFFEEAGIAPPYWAFAWPGAEALARHILDHPHLVAGKRVLDFAAGGGLAAIACAAAGATIVEANEIDPLAIAAISLNAALNNVKITPVLGDIVGRECAWDVILCGDVCYEAPMTKVLIPWLRTMAKQALVIVADPGRAYLPVDGMHPLAQYDVPTTMELEDRLVRKTTLFQLVP